MTEYEKLNLKLQAALLGSMAHLISKPPLAENGESQALRKRFVQEIQDLVAEVKDVLRRSPEVAPGQ